MDKKYCLSAVLLVHYHVEQYGADDNDTFCQRLVVRVDPQEVHAVVDTSDDDRSEKYAGRGRNTAGKRRTAKYAGCNGVCLVTDTDVGLCGTCFTCEDDTCKSCQQTADGVAERLRPEHADTGCDRSVYVAADCVYVAAETGPVHQDIHDDYYDCKINDRSRDRPEFPGVDGFEAWLRHGYRLAGADDLRDTSYDQLRRQRNNKREHVKFGNQNAVDEAEQSGRPYCDDAGKREVPSSFADELAEDTAYESELRADRQVDTSGRNRETHTVSDQAVDGNLSENVQQVIWV